MNKAEKIKLLKNVKDGNISLDNLPFHLASIGLTDVAISLWSETEPGIYKHKETGRVLKEGEPPNAINPCEIIIKVKLFHEDGTKVPRLASAESEIDLD